MSLKETHKEYILEKIYKDFLRQGIIPTSEDLENLLIEYQKTYKDLEKPTCLYHDFSVEKGSESSSSNISNMMDIFSNDLSIVTREIYNLSKNNSFKYERLIQHIKKLSLKSDSLSNKINNLLLLSDNTEGYFASIENNFIDFSLLDTENTSVLISENTVLLNSKYKSNLGMNLIDLSDLKQEDIQFNILSKKPGMQYFPLGGKNDLINIVKTNNSVWIYKVTSPSNQSISCELKLNIDNKGGKEISKVVFEWVGKTSTRDTISLLYSNDGYTWNLVSSIDSTKTLSLNNVWNFPLTNIKSLKFVITKACSDSGRYEYYFSARSIKLLGNKYDSSIGNILITKPLFVKDKNDSIVEFSTSSINVCESLQKNTNINYYLSGSKDNELWTDWIPIVPLNREDNINPKVVNFSGVSWNDNINNIKLIDSTQTNQKKIVRSFDEEFNSYRFKSNKFGVINNAIPINEDDNLTNNIVVWRNIIDKSIYPDTTTVRGVPKGWSFDGKVYTCYFELKQSKLFDFGDTNCIIDNISVKQKVTVSSGVHKFSTSVENWFDISQNINNFENVISSEEILKTLDPLYPYNHKLIIEGYKYPDVFTGSKIYTGVDICAEFYCEKCSLFWIENNTDDLRFFSVRSIGNENPYLSIVVKYDDGNTDYTNELFYVKWKYIDGSELYKYIRLKAELETSDNSVSPSLSSYSIKLGV